MSIPAYLTTPPSGDVTVWCNSSIALGNVG